MTIIDLRPTDDVVELRARVRAFMEEHVYPNEPALDREDDGRGQARRRLQGSREGGGALGAAPPARGGRSNGSFLTYAFLNEEIGRSLWGQLILGCQAPDAGNGEILWQFGTEEQKERWLKPLVAGEVRSFFSMTEPDVSGSDPTGLRTRAVLDGDEWVIDGHKWFSSGAEGASFGIVMAVTEPDAEPHRRATPDRRPGRHARGRDRAGDTDDGTPRPRLDDALRGALHGRPRAASRTPSASRVTGSGSRRSGSGPGASTTSCAGSGRCSARSSSCARIRSSVRSFGGPLAEKQTIQNWIADSAAEIQACRLLTLDAAHKIDQGDEARVEVSLIKFYAAKALNDVIDRAVQVHGARGLTDETPLSGMSRKRARRGSTTARTRCTAWSSPPDPQVVRGRRRLAFRLIAGPDRARRSAALGRKRNEGARRLLVLRVVRAAPERLRLRRRDPRDAQQEVERARPGRARTPSPTETPSRPARPRAR